MELQQQKLSKINKTEEDILELYDYQLKEIQQNEEQL
jgi:hypothetical protein